MLMHSTFCPHTQKAKAIDPSFVFNTSHTIIISSLRKANDLASTEPFNYPSLEKNTQEASGPALFESSCHFIFDSQVLLIKLNVLTWEIKRSSKKFINTLVFGETLVTVIVLVFTAIMRQYIWERWEYEKVSVRRDLKPFLIQFQ